MYQKIIIYTELRKSDIYGPEAIELEISVYRHSKWEIYKGAHWWLAGRFRPTKHSYWTVTAPRS